MHDFKTIKSKNRALEKVDTVYLKQLPIFKELNPYSGQLDTNNRWIKLSKIVPWDEMDVLYRKYFDERKHGVIKKSRVILGLLLGQMFLEMSDRTIIEYFHENPFFQHFCGEDSFVFKTEKTILHPSLLSKRRKRLGKNYVAQFEREVLGVLKRKGLIKGKKLILDATVFPANITYPNDVKLLNTAREYLCQTILDVKNTYDPKGRIRTFRRSARKLYLNFQKTKRKSKKLIRITRNKMIRYVRRNIQQLDKILQEAKDLKSWQKEKIESNLNVAKEVLRQQTHLARTRGRQIADRIVSFNWPQVRPIVRGKDGKSVEFGPKGHVSLVDGYAFLDKLDYSNFHEGILLQESLKEHKDRFQREPDIVLADQIYGTRSNRALLKEKEINHSFKQVGRLPQESPEEKSKRKRQFKKRQGQRNHIEAAFGHLKTSYNLDKIKWRVSGGESMQVQLGLIAFNLNTALAKA